MKHSLQNPGGKLLTYNLKKDAKRGGIQMLDAK